MNPFRLTTRLAAARDAGGGGPLSHPSLAPTGARRDAHAEVVDTTAVYVPWRVERRSASGVEVVNVGDVPLRAARFALAGSGLLGLSLPRTVHPGERLRVVLRGAVSDGVRGAPDAILTLRWFQPDGRELLWPIAL